MTSHQIAKALLHLPEMQVTVYDQVIEDWVDVRHVRYKKDRPSIRLATVAVADYTDDPSAIPHRPLRGAALPSPLTPGQEALKAKHGTPEEFASACWNALGTISVDDVNNAIRKYNLEFYTA